MKVIAYLLGIGERMAVSAVHVHMIQRLPEILILSQRYLSSYAHARATRRPNRNLRSR